MKPKPKSKPVMEFMMTYGWAFLVMIAVIAGIIALDPLQVTTPDQVSNNTDITVTYNEAKGHIEYKTTLDKPTPCGNLTSDASVLPANTIMNQSLLVVTVNYEEANKVCAQKVTPTNVTGTIDAESRPGQAIVTTTNGFRQLNYTTSQ